MERGNERVNGTAVFVDSSRLDVEKEERMRRQFNRALVRGGCVAPCSLSDEKRQSEREKRERVCVIP